MGPTIKFVIFALLILPVEAYGQFRAAKCEVQPLWVTEEVRSANFGLVGSFEKDGKEGTAIRSFRLEGTPLVATVGIRYESEYSNSKPKPYAIRLAIAVSDKEQQEVFESAESSEAMTRHTKKWNLSVTKNVNFDDRIYMFSLRCWDAEGFVGKRPLY